MALVFVHGIGNRSGHARYQGAVDLRDALFRRFLVTRAYPELSGLPINNPMWGDLGAQLRWQHASLPTARQERLGADESLTDLASLVGSVHEGRTVLDVAHDDARDAVDLLYTCVDLRGRSPQEIDDLADLAVALVDLCDSPKATAHWLADVADDDELLDRFHRLARDPSAPEGTERLGAGDRIGRQARRLLADGLSRYRRHTLGLPARTAAAALRRLAAKPLSLLIGDIMCYLDTRGTREQPGDIVRLVSTALDDARQDGPLVVVAHSMGGNIVYDILSHFRPDLRVDALVTVGSQVGLFEELALFHSSDTRLPNPQAPRVPALPNMGTWINVVDPADILAYRTDTVFEGTVEYEYPSDEPWAHSAYFRQPHFHQRLADRLDEARP
ncbi:hypothetical protein ACIRQQ_15810 [Streptomyces fuscichromogenes]|uniref:hypothetical protein n=1 Tax=Streptomyces fuscichromogenes TaxID=1324013 RepID=UPI0037F46766